MAARRSVPPALAVAELEAIAATRPWIRSGGAGWGIIALGILLWDLTQEDQLSDAWKRAHRRGLVEAIALGTSWAVITAHLYGVLPSRFDPLHAIYALRVMLKKEQALLEASAM
jgi:hypothetical protein